MDRQYANTLERFVDQDETLRQDVTQVSGQIGDDRDFWPWSVIHRSSLTHRLHDLKMWVNSSSI